MKMLKRTTRLIPILLLAVAARADTPLTVGMVDAGVGGPCWDDTLVVLNPPSATGTFALPGVSGTGIINSTVAYVDNNILHQQHLLYKYSISLGQMSPSANHCLKVLIHFGTPHTCTYDVLVFNGTGSVPVSSAAKAPLGDITFQFGSGCLSPPQTANTFGLLTDTPPRTNVVTIIDDFVDPASGLTNETRVSVTAVVPDIPPNWAFAPPLLPYVFFQGDLSLAGTNQYNCNSVPIVTVTNGPYDFSLQLVDALSNGLPLGPSLTQTVQVVNGLFNLPLPFDPISLGDGSVRWLDLGVRPSMVPAVQFTGLGRLPIAPAPQAFYAYSAGVVANLSPGQAVTSLNGLKDAVMLQAGNGILLGTNGNTLTFSAQPGTISDRSVKTDFSAVNPAEVLARLAALPLQSWRYTNDPPDVRHLGPMAQDFHQTFRLGADDKFIGFVDEQGVALAAIQGLNERLDELQKELQRKEAENGELKRELAELRELVLKLAKPGERP